MLARRSASVVCWCLAIGALGGTTASGQYIQGTDQGSILMTDPDNWTRVIIDKGALEDDTVTFYLNPCEYLVYWDAAGAPRSCMKRVGICSLIPAMEEKLEDALAVWGSLAGDALNLEYGGILGGSCPTDPNNCPAADAWTDDGDWVVTRDYIDELDEEECEDADTPATHAAGALRLYDDPGTDHTTRWIRECDIVYPAQAWDVTADHPCRQAGLDFTECDKASTMGLAHEAAHCLGFGHSYFTRKSLDPLESNLAGLNLELLEGLPSLMSYDHPGSIDIADNGLNPYDVALYLYTYSDAPDPLGDNFAAYGTVVTDADNDCTPLTSPQPVFGAAVVALDATATPTVRPIHISMTGSHPLGAGQFELKHLDRGGGSKDYRLLVVDARDANQLNANGWEFDDLTEGPVPKLPVSRTDLWDEEHSGDPYTYETSAQFDTGFDFELRAKFDAPASGDHNAGTICVEF